MYQQQTSRHVSHLMVLVMMAAYSSVFSSSFGVWTVQAFVPQTQQASVMFSFALSQTTPSNENNNQDNNNKKRDEDNAWRAKQQGKDHARRILAANYSNNNTLLVTDHNGASSPRTTIMDHETNNNHHHQNNVDPQMMHRITQLEELVARQAVDIKRLQQECHDLTQAAQAFAKVVEMLRASGLKEAQVSTKEATAKDNIDDDEEEETMVFLDEDADIFGPAPSSVMDAADAAGAAILAALLGGQQRLLVDVRDADLTLSTETLVQFIELAILPVAAGLEGLRSKRNRLKIVFPTVKQLLEYRKTMALAAPEVVALSTLNYDPVEDQDNLVVIVAPAPDDEEGCRVMNQLLAASEQAESNNKENKTNKKDNPSITATSTVDEDRAAPPRTPAAIRQPIVVFNPHMVPISGPATSYEVAYHLRLLSVQYKSLPTPPKNDAGLQQEVLETMEQADVDMSVIDDYEDSEDGANTESIEEKDDKEKALEAAMKHARQVNLPGGGGSKAGTTRAMVIRAYPNPWHVFVDTSPDTDADFSIAATFDEAPSLDDVQMSIIECLDGSEREDEIVAQQMQEALEAGQLDRVSEILGVMGVDLFDDEEDEDDDEDKDDPWRRLYGIDSV